MELFTWSEDSLRVPRMRWTSAPSLRFRMLLVTAVDGF
ncbi:hypothetical protein Rhow_000751 [Rhodococcus wratislaviensis]|uniref:Uncharacterized protein n=1 Tax=Rhodococcus wratislaviensis TaxID=44752 RepID=A0A402C2S2_RHOWR|nr:hypothetical protein Rhow_000751 [Rhodococcus wratislaviensis]